MQITNQVTHAVAQTSDRKLNLREGEVYQATVKERLPGNEAILQIRGHDIHTRWEGTAPSSDRVTIQVSENRQEIPVVRAIAEERGSSSNKQSDSKDINRVLRNLGVTQGPSTELRQAAQTLLDKGVPLTKDAVQELQRYFNSKQGTVEQRQQTIEAMANKRLEITPAQVRAVHEALHGRPIGQVLSDITNEISLNSNLGRENEQARHYSERQAEQIQNVAKERLSQANAERAAAITETAGVNQQEQTANVTVKGQSIDQRISEAFRQMQQILRKEANFERAIEQIKLNASQNLNADVETLDQLTKATEDSQHLQNQGRELAARQHIMQVLSQLEQQAATIEQTQNNEAARLPLEQNQYINNEQLQTSVQFSSKDFLVTTISEKLAQAAADFKNLQREITRNLDIASRLIDQYKNQAQHQAKPLLETTIKKLDHAILKSEMMLLTDMKTEKRLMQASGQLAEAKKLLSKGQYYEASRIVQEVKSLVERMQFKPSETKVMHFINNEKQLHEAKTPTQHVMRQMNDIVKLGYEQEASARQTFEMVRSLGLNRDRDLGMMLVNSREQVDQNANHQNLKTSLMSLIRGEEENSRLSQQANQALNNLTGQQLLSKSDQGNLQSMFFNLPFLLEEQVENLQVFVNSRNEGQQVDWENCNLYFLIDTPKLGEIGIMVSVVDRNLSVTLKNNQPMFQTRMEPLVDQCVDNIKEIGYNVNGIKYTKLSTEPEKQTTTSENNASSEKQQPIFTKKGFDYKI